MRRLTKSTLNGKKKKSTATYLIPTATYLILKIFFTATYLILSATLKIISSNKLNIFVCKFLKDAKSHNHQHVKDALLGLNKKAIEYEDEKVWKALKELKCVNMILKLR